MTIVETNEIPKTLLGLSPAHYHHLTSFLINPFPKYPVLGVVIVATAAFSPTRLARRPTSGLPMSFNTENDGLSSQALATNELRSAAAPAMAAMLTALVGAQSALAEDGAAALTTATATPKPTPEKKDLGPPPAAEDYGVTGSFYPDCAKVVAHMRYAVQMEKGTPRIAEIAQKTKDEMGDFVSYYRRFNGTSITAKN